MRKSIVAVLTLVALVQAAPRANGQEESKSPCATAQAGQFDF